VNRSVVCYTRFCGVSFTSPPDALTGPAARGNEMRL